MELTSRKILLVGKHKQQAIPHLAVGQDPLELCASLVDSLPVSRVNHEDESLRIKRMNWVDQSLVAWSRTSCGQERVVGWAEPGDEAREGEVVVARASSCAEPLAVLARVLTATRNDRTDLCTCVVVSPEGSDLVLSSYVPDVELYVAVGDGLDVEADRRDRRHRLVQLELVQNR